MSDLTIRALVQIDNLQPKFAAYNGATVQGSIPLSGDTILIGEIAPGNGVFALIDRALKASSVEATSQIVEREFGFFILRSPSNAEVSAARDAILAELGASMNDRVKPAVASTQIITSVEPYQAQLLNKWRKGTELSLADIEKSLGIPVAATIAYDEETCLTAINAGRILRDVDKRSQVVRDISAMVSLATEGVMRVEASSADKKPFGWLFK